MRELAGLFSHRLEHAPIGVADVHDADSAGEVEEHVSSSHQGEEFIHMLAGTLEIWLDELECHTLQQGDSLWFESTVGHRWFNPSSEESVLLWINTPPAF